MKPLGRKYYKDKTGGKHPDWWEDVCEPNKRLEKRNAKREIEEGISEGYDSGGYCKGGSCDVTHLYPEDVFKIADSVQCAPLDILFLEHDIEAEVCIYIKGKWSGYLSSAYSYRNGGSDSQYSEYLEWITAHGHCETGSWDCPDEEDCPWKKGLFDFKGE